MVLYMDAGAAVVTISAFAAAISEGKTIEELDTIALFLTQLSNSVTTIASLKSKQLATEIIEEVV